MNPFSAIGSAITSALTPAGTNARRKQEAGQQKVGDLANQIAGQEGQRYKSALDYNYTMDPYLRNALRSMGYSTTQAGLRQQAIGAGNQARAQAMSQSVPMQYQGNPWMANAYRAQQMNQAQDQTNSALFNAYSPQARNQALMSLLQAQNAYAGQYGNSFNSSAGLSFGQPQVQVQPGLMDMVGGAIGNWAGNQAFGKAGKGFFK